MTILYVVLVLIAALLAVILFRAARFRPLPEEKREAEPVDFDNEAAIRALRESCPGCRVMVGGAVLTPEYARTIGADYYAKDAKRSADIAEEVLG